jgi:phage recombination protein Bet
MTAATDTPTVAPEGAPEDPDAIRERGKDLEQVTKRGLHTGEPAYLDFQPQMRNLIKQALLPSDATDADLFYLLEMAATYKLDPFARELWAVKMPGRNAGQGAHLTIMVGRDGMLAIAERHPEHQGYRCQAVYEHDQFSYSADARQAPDGTWTHVSHSFGMPNKRGELLGAWAEVYRAGRPPVFFYAPLEEYDKGDNDYSPWRKQRTVMIEKCALVTALRHAYRISGLYIADEMSGAMLAPKAEVAKVESGEANWGDDEGIKHRLGDLFAALQYPPAKQRLKLAGLSGDDERRALIQELVEECGSKGVEVPPLRVLDPDDEFVADTEVEVVEPAEEEVDDGIEFAPHIPPAGKTKPAQEEPPVEPTGQTKLS